MAPVSNLSLANRLLAALPAEDRAQLLQQCELVELKPHTVVLAEGEEMHHAWFPVEGFVSLQLPLEQGEPLEVGLVGDEGLFNASVLLRPGPSGLNCRAQATGRAFRIEARALSEQLQRSPALERVLHGYLDLRQAQLARQAACLVHHSVAQRLARWLLMTRDRAHSSELFLTHETLSLMLHARRESVTQAARRMQLLGHISYSRGYMMLLDEAALAATACPCWRTDRQAYEAWWVSVAPPELTSK